MLEFFFALQLRPPKNSAAYQLMVVPRGNRYLAVHFFDTPRQGGSAAIVDCTFPVGYVGHPPEV